MQIIPSAARDESPCSPHRLAQGPLPVPTAGVAAMPPHSPAQRRGLARIGTPCMLAALLVAGCGGGGIREVTEQALASPTSAAAASVQLEGCVVSSDWLGAPATAVHVRTEDGRLIGTAYTNSRGSFVLAVPARAAIVLDTSVAGPGGLALNTGSGALSVAACLIADL